MHHALKVLFGDAGRRQQMAVSPREVQSTGAVNLPVMIDPAVCHGPGIVTDTVTTLVIDNDEASPALNLAMEMVEGESGRGGGIEFAQGDEIGDVFGEHGAHEHFAVT